MRGNRVPLSQQDESSILSSSGRVKPQTDASVRKIAVSKDTAPPPQGRTCSYTLALVPTIAVTHNKAPFPNRATPRDAKA